MIKNLNAMPSNKTFEKQLQNDDVSSLWTGNEQTVRLLLQSGTNVNEMNEGETALHAVATSGTD